MKKVTSSILVLIIILAGITVIGVPTSSNTNDFNTNTDSISSGFNPPHHPPIYDTLNQLDGYFTRNQGQIDDEAVKFFCPNKGIWFLEDGVVFEIKDNLKVLSPESVSPESGSPESEFEDLEPRKSIVLKLKFEGANNILPEGRELSNHRSNFFYGNDPAKWRTNVPNYYEIVYEEIYNNIDLKYYVTTNGLKYDFIVHPGGEPNDIRIRYDGMEKIYINTIGDLIITTPYEDVIDTNPFIYQPENNVKNEINGNFKIINSNTYGFEIGDNFDRDKVLVIDPLIYSTFIGSTGYDLSNGIDVDANGNAYATGYADGSNFPTTAGAYDTKLHNSKDVFVAKLNSTGSDLIFSTFIGGASSDEGKDIVVDSNGDAYITGLTTSSDFPFTLNSYDTGFNGGSDVFIVKLNSFGSNLMYSTFIGGVSSEIANRLAIDPDLNAYLTGWADSSNFPTTPGAFSNTHNGGGYDIFVAKFNLSGNDQNDLIYSTFVGGSGMDLGHAITVDSNGNAYVTGRTTFSSTVNFPIKTGAYSASYNGGTSDAFLIKLNPAGSALSISTFLGGNDYEEGNGIAIDSENNIYITGKTQSSDFPTTANVIDTSINGNFDIYIVKFAHSGSALRYSTFIGGSNEDQGRDIEVDFYGNALITGYTSSANFPITDQIAYDNSHNGNFDIVVVKISPLAESLSYSSFFGGSNDDYGYGVASDSDFKIYVTGGTKSINFPNSTGAYNISYNGGFMDGYIIKLEFNHRPIVTNLTVSTSSIFRTETVYLYSNVTDIEDLESELVPSFKYRDANHITWLDENIGTPTYTNNRWEVSFTPDKTVWVGDYELSVVFTDKGLRDSKMFYLYDGLKVLNNFPILEDLTLSQEEAYQNEEISAWVNGNDIEDPEQNLTVALEYKTSNENFWVNEFITPPEYVIDEWTFNFTVPFGAAFGQYSFRANITDADGNYTGWSYANDSLLITNHQPDIIDCRLSKYTAFRNETVFLISNCSDYETPGPELNYQAEYRYKDDTEWQTLPGIYTENNWQSNFNNSIDSKLGYYYFRVMFEDNANISTEWYNLEEPLELLNNPPVIANELDEIKIGMKTVTIPLTPFETDVEDGNYDLSWSVNETKSYNLLKSVRIIDLQNDILEIAPKIDVVGDVDIELTLTDKDGGTDTRSNITLHINSTITEMTPKVTLLSPADDSIINTLTPKLEWKLDYAGAEELKYTLYIYEAPEPKTVVESDITTTSFVVNNNLQDHKMYHWWVMPSWGITLSEPFSFTINLSFEIKHNVNLTSERTFVSLKQGESILINLTVENQGNVKDTFSIEYNAEMLEPTLTIDNSTIQIEKDASAIVKLQIELPSDFVIDTYTISLKATSMGNKSKTDALNINVEVLSKFFIANYDVKLDVIPTSINLEQSTTKNVVLKIDNIGNVADEYYLEFRSVTFTGGAVQILEQLIFVLPGSAEQVEVIITAPEDIEPLTYTINFTARSYKTLAHVELIVNVIKSTQGPEAPEDKGREEDSAMQYAIYGIIILIIVILIILFIYTRKKREEKYLQTIKGEDTKQIIADKEPLSPEKEGTEPTTTDVETLPMAQPMKEPGNGEEEQSPLETKSHDGSGNEPQELSYLKPQVVVSPTIKQKTVDEQNLEEQTQTPNAFESDPDKSNSVIQPTNKDLITQPTIQPTIVKKTIKNNNTNK